MKKRVLAGTVLVLFSLAVLLAPWPGNYQSPLLWTPQDRGDQAVDVFLVGATADLGKDGTFQTSVWGREDRYWQRSLLHMQEGLYREDCRIYAPYYRQACLSVYYLEDPARGPYLSLAYGDVKKAFSWYLSHENQGRPLILAGYSQGADLALRLLEEFFGDESLRSRLVAAYLIGWRVTEEDLRQFPHLKMAQGELDTGVIVSFNSEAEFVTGSIILPEGGYTYGINPLSWRTDSQVADKSMNPGAVDIHMDGSADNDRPGLTGCYRDPDRGTIIPTDISPKDYPAGEPIFVEGCYHNYELNLYYRSVQENVKTRIGAYLSAAH